MNQEYIELKFKDLCKTRDKLTINNRVYPVTERVENFGFQPDLMNYGVKVHLQFGHHEPQGMEIPFNALQGFFVDLKTFKEMLNEMKPTPFRYQLENISHDKYDDDNSL